MQSLRVSFLPFLVSEEGEDFVEVGWDQLVCAVEDS